MHHLLFAGLSWSPAISGILTVTVAVAILMGSVYLIVATNTGARLGLMISLAGLFGWLSILTLYWWITPPGIGPRGQDPSWVPVEVYVHQPDGGQGAARTEVLHSLPDPSQVPSAAQVIAEHPELAAQLVSKPENTTLSDIAAIKVGDSDYVGANVLKQYFGIDSTSPTTATGPSNSGGWKIVNTSSAGEAAAAADAALVAAKLPGISDATGYKRVNAWEIGGDQTRAEACPAGEGDTSHNLVPPDAMCRAMYRLKRTLWLWHPPRYQVIQVQPVIHQETVPGEAPPVPKIDPDKPVISIVLIRDQGNVRAKPAYFFAISFSLFIVFVLMLHYRDKTLTAHLDEAKALESAAKKQKD